MRAPSGAVAPSPGCLGSTPACLIVNLCAVVIGADFAVLPAAFREIGRDLSATPAQLGVINLAVGVSSSLAGLLAGVLAGSCSRTRLVGGGCLLWGATAAVMGLCQTYEQLLIARSVNGIGVGMVSPLLFSIVADTTPEQHRGRAFGILCLTQSLGSTGGGFVSTVLSGYRDIELLGFHVAGWRCSLFGLCIVGLLLGLAMLLFGRDPPAVKPSSTPTKEDYCRIARMRTFQVIVAQGCFGAYCPSDSALSLMLAVPVLCGGTHTARR